MSTVVQCSLMLLEHLRIVGVGTFDELECSFKRHDEPRLTTVVLGGGGVGKTTLLAAIACTRPGYSVAPHLGGGRPDPRALVVADWRLGDDDLDRPHPLRVTSPTAVLADETEEQRVMRRREQALYDRRAPESGFVLVAFSGTRWFSRAPVLLTAPDRTVLRYDVRAAPNFDDGSRGDLARETKQALCYARVSAAIAGREHDGVPASAQRFDEAMHTVADGLASLSGYRYVGVEASSLEPIFETRLGETKHFDNLPASVRHLVSFGALTVRALHAGYPGQDPRACEGVVLIDEPGMHQEDRVQQSLVPTLAQLLPRVQWIVTSSSHSIALGCQPSEVVALRRMPSSHRVELFEGELAVLH